MKAMFCTNCGAKLTQENVFCDQCGTPVAQILDEPQANSAFAGGSPANPASVAGLQQSPAYATGSQTANAPGKGGGKMPVIANAAAAAVVILLAVVLGAVFGGSSGGNSGGKAQPAPSSTSSASESTSGSAPVFKSVQVSSVLPPDDDTGYYGEGNLTDGRPETAWNEGSAGDGTGEWVKMSADSPQTVSTISIMGGYPKTYKDGSDIYYKNNRPKDITISYDGGSKTFTMDDIRGQFQTFTFSTPIETKQLTITINSVYPGGTYNDCCIAEVKVS